MKIIQRVLVLILVFATACAPKGFGISPIATGELKTPVPTDEAGVDPDSLTPQPSVLDINRQNAINDAAQKLLADNEQQAIRVARSLHFANRQEDPSNMCGPLSLSILRDAGIVMPTVPLHSFWLLNPRVNRKLVNEILPSDQFYDWRFKTPLNAFNFQTFPLQTGDFLYIYAGRNGNFDHMLVVNRIDDAGRAYAVTNFDVAPKNFVIREVMLYDPSAPGKGKFYDWTSLKNWRLGLTGFGGFELWRRKIAVTTP